MRIKGYNVYPHLEETYRFAELVFPKLSLRAATGQVRGIVRYEGPFGEIIANDLVPSPRTVAAG